MFLPNANSFARDVVVSLQKFNYRGSSVRCEEICTLYRAPLNKLPVTNPSRFCSTVSKLGTIIEISLLNPIPRSCWITVQFCNFDDGSVPSLLCRDGKTDQQVGLRVDREVRVHGRDFALAFYATGAKSLADVPENLRDRQRKDARRFFRFAELWAANAAVLDEDRICSVSGAIRGPDELAIRVWVQRSDLVGAIELNLTFPGSTYLRPCLTSPKAVVHRYNAEDEQQITLLKQQTALVLLTQKEIFRNNTQQGWVLMIVFAFQTTAKSVNFLSQLQQ